ncbi:MAG: hypothetical protein ACPGJI_00705 [Kangiellaceae bacterium]
MKHLNLIPITLCSIVMSANAGFEARIESKNPVSNSVRSHLVDKSIFARSDAQSSVINIEFRGRCDKGWLTKFGVEIGGDSYWSSVPNGESKSITSNRGKKWVTYGLLGQKVLSADNPTLIKACNDQLDKKLKQGFDLETLLASDFSVNNALSIPLKLNYTCKKRVGFSDPPVTDRIVDHLNVNAICKASNYQLPIEVSGTTLEIDKQVTMGGLCKVNLKGALNTNKPNQLVRFRYEQIDQSFNKKLSQIHRVTTDQQGYANFAHEYPVANGPGKERGKMRVIGVSHEFQSAQKSYSMNCSDGGPGSLQQAGNSTIKLNAKPLKRSNKPFGNQICPTKIKFTGTIKAGNDFSGKAVFVGQSLADVRVKNFSIKKGQTKRINRVRDLIWSAPSTTTLSTGGGIAPKLMTQDVMQGLNIVGDNSQKIILSSPRKPFQISCERASVQPGLQLPNGGLNTLPSHTGGGAPTDLQGNQQTTSPLLPAKPSATKKSPKTKKKRSKSKK